jgi:hypothetical protein
MKNGIWIVMTVLAAAASFATGVVGQEKFNAQIRLDASASKAARSPFSRPQFYDGRRTGQSDQHSRRALP